MGQRVKLGLRVNGARRVLLGILVWQDLLVLQVSKGQEVNQVNPGAQV